MKIQMLLKLAGLLTLAVVLSVLTGCASWRVEPVAVKTEVESLWNIEVVAPRVYRDANGYFAVGYLRAKSHNAHLTLAHLHALLVDAQGNVITDITGRAPNIQHQRFAPQETVGYSFDLEKNATGSYSIRLRQSPVAGGTLKVVLHEGSTRKCKSSWASEKENR